MRIVVGLTIGFFVGILAVTWIASERAHPKFLHTAEPPQVGHH